VHPDVVGVAVHLDRPVAVALLLASSQEAARAVEFSTIGLRSSPPPHAFPRLYSQRRYGRACQRRWRRWVAPQEETKACRSPQRRLLAATMRRWPSHRELWPAVTPPGRRRTHRCPPLPAASGQHRHSQHGRRAAAPAPQRRADRRDVTRADAAWTPLPQRRWRRRGLLGVVVLPAPAGPPLARRPRPQ